MYTYRVVRCEADGHQVILQDYRGQTYRVRPLSQAPMLADVLEGARPHLGFGILICKLSGQTYRVIFEEIGGPRVAVPGVG